MTSVQMMREGYELMLVEYGPFFTRGFLTALAYKASQLCAQEERKRQGGGGV